jgi:hypothetical protein
MAGIGKLDSGEDGLPAMLLRKRNKPLRAFDPEVIRKVTRSGQ